MDLGQSLRVEVDCGKIFGARHNLGQAGVEFGEEANYVEAEITGCVWFQIPMHACMEFSGAADVAISKMIEGYSSLDQGLVVPPRRTAVFGPEFLPDLMALVVVAGVKKGNSFEVKPLVVVGGRFTTHDLLSVIARSRPTQVPGRPFPAPENIIPLNRSTPVKPGHHSTPA